MSNYLEAPDEPMLQSLLINQAAHSDERPFSACSGGPPFTGGPPLSDVPMSSIPGMPNYQAPASYTSIAPKPGFCLKTKDESGGKVFVNVCPGENIPKPEDITEEDLIYLLESEDPSGFRIPMSIGEGHTESDKSGKDCIAYDVIIHEDFYKKLQTSQVMMGFFVTVTLEGIDEKYKKTLDREWKILKNKKFIGTLKEQNVRTQSKPWIYEMENEKFGKSPLISETSSVKPKESPKPKAPEPAFKIIQEPAEGHPEFLVAEIHLPKVKTASTVFLDIGEDRILLQTRSNSYFLDIYLPYDIIQEDSVSQFNRNTKILTVTMPVVPKS